MFLRKNLFSFDMIKPYHNLDKDPHNIIHRRQRYPQNIANKALTNDNYDLP